MIGSQDDRRTRPPRGNQRGRVLFWSLFGILVCVAAWLLFWPRGPRPVEDDGIATADEPARGLNSVTLYFGDEEGRTVIAERREVAAGTSLEARVEACMLALAEGPEQHGAARTLPAGARVRQVFFDNDTATLYLDFDPVLVTQHPGGSASEYLTLSSIVRTVGANFPDVARVQLLVDHQPIESLAGHFDTSKPIEIATWQ